MSSINTTSVCPKVIFNCSAEDLSSTNLRWLIDGNIFASYLLDPDDEYPIAVEPSNTTLNALIGGVDIQILAASQNEDNLDIASYLSIMTVNNISALQGAGASTLSCGRFTERDDIDLTLNTNQGKL